MANLLESGFLQTQNTGTFKTDYEYLESVGQGGFGEVFKAKYKHDDHIYAVKKVRFDQFKNKYQLHLIRRELVNNAKLSHENVVRYYHSWTEVSDDQNVYDDSTTESTGGITETTASGEENSKDVFLATNITAARISNNGQNHIGLHNKLRFWHSESLDGPFKDGNELRENVKLSAVGKSGIRTKSSVTDTDEDDSDDWFMDFKAENKAETHNIPKLEEFFKESDAECVTEGRETEIESDAEFDVDETEVSGNKNNRRASSVAETDEDVFEDQNSPDGYHDHIVQQFNFDIEDVFDEIDNSEILSRSGKHSDESAVSGEEDETESPRFYELYIKMEFCDYTLRDRIDEGLLVNDKIRCWNFFRQLIRGLDYIHNQHVIHRDLNPKNIFVTNNDIVKIGDFGLSRIKGETHAEYVDERWIQNASKDLNANTSNLTGNIGTRWYSAPEVLSNSSNKYGPECDLFSLGLIFFEMCYCPMKTEQEKAQIFEPLRNDRKFPDNFDDIRLQSQKKIINGLLSLDPKERISLRALLDPVSSYLPAEPIEEKQFKMMLQDILSKPNSELHSFMLKQMFSRKTKCTESFPSGKVRSVPLDFTKVTEIFSKGARKHNAKHISLPLFLTMTEEDMFSDRHKPDGNKTFLDNRGNPVELPESSAIAFSQELIKGAFPENSRYYSTEMVYKRNRWEEDTIGVPQLSYFMVSSEEGLFEIGRACLILQETVLGVNKGINDFVLYVSHKNIELGILKLYRLERVYELLKVICGVVNDPSRRLEIVNGFLEKRIPSFFVTPDTFDTQLAKVKKSLRNRSKKQRDRESKSYIKSVLNAFKFLNTVRMMLRKFGVQFSVHSDLFMRSPAGVVASGIKFSLRPKVSSLNSVPAAEGGYYKTNPDGVDHKQSGFLYLAIDSKELSLAPPPQNNPDVIIVFNRRNQGELDNTAHLIGSLSTAGFSVAEVERHDGAPSPLCRFLVNTKANDQVILQYEDNLRAKRVQMKLKTVLKHIKSRDQIEYSRQWVSLD